MNDAELEDMKKWTSEQDSPSSKDNNDQKYRNNEKDVGKFDNIPGGRQRLAKHT